MSIESYESESGENLTEMTNTIETITDEQALAIFDTSYRAHAQDKEQSGEGLISIKDAEPKVFINRHTSEVRVILMPKVSQGADAPAWLECRWTVGAEDQATIKVRTSEEFTEEVNGPTHPDNPNNWSLTTEGERKFHEKLDALAS